MITGVVLTTLQLGLGLLSIAAGRSKARMSRSARVRSLERLTVVPAFVRGPAAMALPIAETETEAICEVIR